MARLNLEQIEEIRAFITSPTAEQLFEQLVDGTVADWTTATTTTAREEQWHLLQAISLLAATLRDAAAMKRMTDRAQDRRGVQI